MVCDKCQKKLGSRIIVQDKWKDGAANTIESGGRKINENKLLSKTKRYAPYDVKCKTCKTLLASRGLYCQTCAYKKGVCAMCGVAILDTTSYKQSTA